MCFFERLGGGGRGDGSGVATPHHRVATPSRGSRHFAAELFFTCISFKHSMRPVASSRRRHASAQRRDTQSKLGSLNAEQRLAFDVLPIKQFAAHRSDRCSRIRRQPGPYDLARVPRFITLARSNS